MTALRHPGGTVGTSHVQEGQNAMQDALYAEVLKQIQEVRTATDEASRHIMNALDHCFALQQDMQGLIEDLHSGILRTDQLVTLREINEAFGDMLMDVSSRMAFHDIISQRITIAVNALQSIEGGKAVTPQQESPTAVSPAAGASLHGPDSAATQQSVDDLLSSLGL